MSAEAEIRLLSLADSLDPLLDHFNRHRGQLRVLALLSPT